MKKDEIKKDPVDLKKVIRFTRKNWYWIGPAIKEGYEWINKLITKIKQNARNRKD